ncbi:hypothetical protein RchiOBHm_Chr1g0354931 [Rosa chinensis]|uniref:Uncharacterized protein n=1 Tax=Rosa chinensis TaxID=74649 RepID=A0A2P6SH86_ROSCH|nr:hypothetical protein RchiOBHm_Chr1g0354931 [Rosa chinensis]
MLGSHTTMSNSGSHTRPSQVHRDESGATQTVDASRTGTTQMDHRERARASHQEWRQSMSSTQHEAYLARRRAHARGKRLAVENVSDHGQEAGPSNRNRLAPGTFVFLNYATVKSFYFYFFPLNTCKLHR